MKTEKPIGRVKRVALLIAGIALIALGIFSLSYKPFSNMADKWERVTYRNNRVVDRERDYSRRNRQEQLHARYFFTSLGSRLFWRVKAQQIEG